MPATLQAPYRLSLFFFFISSFSLLPLCGNNLLVRIPSTQPPQPGRIPEAIFGFPEFPCFVQSGRLLDTLPTRVRSLFLLFSLHPFCMASFLRFTTFGWSLITNIFTEIFSFFFFLRRPLGPMTHQTRTHALFPPPFSLSMAGPPITALEMEQLLKFWSSRLNYVFIPVFFPPWSLFKLMHWHFVVPSPPFTVDSVPPFFF